MISIEGHIVLKLLLSEGLSYKVNQTLTGMMAVIVPVDSLLHFVVSKKLIYQAKQAIFILISAAT